MTPDHFLSCTCIVQELRRIAVKLTTVKLIAVKLITVKLITIKLGALMPSVNCPVTYYDFAT